MPLLPTASTPRARPAGWPIPSIAARIARRLDERSSQREELDLVLYNAGMDPYEGCDIGGLPGITAEVLIERERLVFDWCRAGSVPVCFVLAGGYARGEAAQAQLVELHRATIAAAVGV